MLRARESQGKERRQTAVHEAVSGIVAAVQRTPPARVVIGEVCARRTENAERRTRTCTGHVWKYGLESRA